jgi:coiled-coil domain-containing protein 130
LRERARKIDQGILIIRFEMPYNIWCLGCNIHIAMGVRYNAQKKKVGKYLSTPIHEFDMKCHLCEQHFIIRTDPQNMDYVILSGARRKEQRWNMAENEQIVTEGFF